jgi:farnesyl diphosphate synthase
MSVPPEEFNRRLNSVAAATEAFLLARLDATARPERLAAAMRHAATGGKRIRPFLLLESARLFAVNERTALAAGAALECVHCYSLVHDDLPARDDDDQRRGQPTTHRAFDEATAILAGDSLLTLAFELLSEIDADADTRIALVALIASASGMSGMAGGQMLDLEAEGRFTPAKQPLALSVKEIEHLQAMKTGALLSAACEAGARLGHASEAERHALARYAQALGLAFQIADDLLDAEGDSKTLGKATAKDATLGKATLVSALGADGARKRLGHLIDEAIEALAPFGERAAMLVACARFIAARER